MLIIDTHSHAGVNWFSPVETLLHEMNMNGVAHSVLVQHGGSYDNAYLFECDKRFPGRFKIVVDVNPQDPKPEATLEKLKNHGAAGVRFRPDSKYKTQDPHAMWKMAGELGLIVSVATPGGSEQLGTAFKKILDACPNTHMQLEHLAGVGYSKPPYNAYKAALGCAKWRNTSIKVPGLGEIIDRPVVLPTGYPFTEFPPLFEMALEAFGPQRMVWGADYPPSGRREGYRNCLEGVRSYPAFQKTGVLDWILGKTAAKIWGFEV